VNSHIDTYYCLNGNLVMVGSPLFKYYVQSLMITDVEKLENNPLLC